MRPKTLLVNPPLWNVYAPHLAVPLLAGVLRQRGWPVSCLDLSIESIDWLLSAEGLAAIGTRIDQRLRQGERDPALDRAALFLEPATDRVEAAKATLRSVDGLFALDEFRRAKIELRNAMWCVSAGFRGLNFDLVANAGAYDKESTRSVLAAVGDPDGNLYRWLFDRHLVPRLHQPDLAMVAISASADTQLIAAMTVARLVREHRPDIHIVMGGNFTTRLVTMFRQRHPFFDLVDSFICYEGEEALPLLCQRQFEGGVGCVPGLADVDTDGRVTVSPPENVDLATVPFPDFSDLPLDRYLSPAPVLPTFASRSCAWNCAFCSIPFASNRFRVRAASAVVDEIEHQKARFGARHFMFVDEIMTVRTLREVSRTLIEREAGIHWYGETRFAANLNRPLAEKLYESGCRRLNLGLESRSQRVLNLMRKGTDVDVIDANVEALLGAKVPIHLFVIFGFPGETPDEAEATTRYAGAVMERAREVHGVPYATWGGSAFTLDRHSPVANEPDAFAITIRPAPRDRDLVLQLDYDVAHDGPQSTGAEIMAGVYAAAAGGSGWAFKWVEQDVEEHLFLRGAFGAPVAGTASEAPPRPLPVPDEGVVLRLDPGVAWRRCRMSITGRRAGTCLALYSPSGDALVELPPACLEVLQARLARRSLAARLAVEAGWSPDEAQGWVRTLLRFGFLSPAGRAGDPEAHWADAAVYEEAGSELHLDQPAESGTVTSLVTGRSVRLNLAGLALWLRCRGAGGTTLTGGALLAGAPAPHRLAAQRLLFLLFDAGLVGFEQRRG